MRRTTAIALTTSLLCTAALLSPLAAAAAPLPPPVAEMITAAADDPAALNAVIAIARKTNPQSLDEIDAMATAIAERRQRAREMRLASQGLHEGWTGKGEFGAFVSTGNSDDQGFTVGLGFAKETLRWRHKVKLAADYRRSGGATSKERYAAIYDANYKIGPRLFAVGVLSAERDRFAGFRSRFTESLGLGYRVIDNPVLTVDLDVGPALRQTRYETTGEDTAFSGRAAGALTWRIAEDLTFTQNIATVVATDNSTLAATSALTTKLFDALSARASFDLRHESDPPAGRETTDTSSRVTLVYSF